MMPVPEISAALRDYMLHPPPDSALERAKAFGIDPTLTFHCMYGMSKEERLERAAATIGTAAQIARWRAERRKSRR
jgi:hypothetical protein